MTDAVMDDLLDDDDARLAQFGYAQKLDRSVGKYASFAIGFSTISATTAVFTGFGAAFTGAGAPVHLDAAWWRRSSSPLGWIAADVAAKIPLAGYTYQWTSRINGPSFGWFTGYTALMGWICGMTGVGFILSGYLGGLFDWNMTQTQQILVAIGVVAVCALINIYGVKFATMVNNIGVSLELVVTLGATLLDRRDRLRFPRAPPAVLGPGHSHPHERQLRTGLARRGAGSVLRPDRGGVGRRRGGGDEGQSLE